MALHQSGPEECPCVLTGRRKEPITMTRRGPRRISLTVPPHLMARFDALILLEGAFPNRWYGGSSHDTGRNPARSRGAGGAAGEAPLGGSTSSALAQSSYPRDALGPRTHWRQLGVMTAARTAPVCRPFNAGRAGGRI